MIGDTPSLQAVNLGGLGCGEVPQNGQPAAAGETRTKMAEKIFQWEETLLWLREHPNAEPGGWEDDLFEMPLSESFLEEYADELEEEWSYAPYWSEQGQPPDDRWSIGGTGYWVVLPAVGEPFILDPEGFIIA